MAQLVDIKEYQRSIDRISNGTLYPKVIFFYDFEDLEDHWNDMVFDDGQIRYHMKRAGFTWDNW